MTKQTVNHQGEPRSISVVDLDRKLDAAGWGLFFVWVGIALLLDVGWGVGLVGVGIITLGEQALRRYFGLAIDGFWIVVGVLFFAGGVWEMAQIQFSMVPFLLILAGVAVLLSVFRRQGR